MTSKHHERNCEICQLDISESLNVCDVCNYCFCHGCGYIEEGSRRTTCVDCVEGSCESCMAPLFDREDVYECLFCGAQYCVEEVRGDANWFICEYCGKRQVTRD